MGQQVLRQILVHKHTLMEANAVITKGKLRKKKQLETTLIARN